MVQPLRPPSAVVTQLLPLPPPVWLISLRKKRRTNQNIRFSFFPDFTSQSRLLRLSYRAMNSYFLLPTHPLLVQCKLISFPFKPSFLSHSHSRSFLCFSSDTGPQSFDREESRWLREEQRWQREEQRWSREEQRWLRERDSLLRQISDLKLRIEALERSSSVQGASNSDTNANVGALLQVLKERSLIAESGESARDLALGEEEEKKVVVEEGVRVLGTPQGEDSGKTKRKALRMGSEGEEVREMQEALQKLGFYSGEEEMEYSSFSSGTERAVKTWQAAIGVPENGVVTAELLEVLYVEKQVETPVSGRMGQKGDVPASKEEPVANGAPVASPTKTSETKNLSQARVFLLGENRWEEPSRLVGRDHQVAGSKTSEVTTKCLTCRGEGRLMCTECDGTGEPNVEPQFLEWVDEGAKCPYCDGLGYTTCDVCDGKTVV